MIGEMGKGFHAFANQGMASPQFSKVVNQVGGVTAGARKQLGDLMKKCLLGMNLPSRTQMVSMAERLASIRLRSRSAFNPRSSGHNFDICGLLEAVAP
ncbi:hypothetical protein GALL_455310 [mine drainage metagenome]|uniref:Uncharacterized protein n=1 Tax=mine drainage metagenome TaxID=410659 RepID=A0A1J5PZ22_9ZZZZ